MLALLAFEENREEFSSQVVESMIVNEAAEKEDGKEEEIKAVEDDQNGEENEVEDQEVDDDQPVKADDVLSFEDWFQSFADYRLDQGMIEEDGASKLEMQQTDNFFDGGSSLIQSGVDDPIEYKEKEEKNKNGKDQTVNVLLKCAGGQDIETTRKRKRDTDENVDKLEDGIEVFEEENEKGEEEEEERGWRSRKRLRAWTGRMGSMLFSWMNRLL